MIELFTGLVLAATITVLLAALAITIVNDPWPTFFAFFAMLALTTMLLGRVVERRRAAEHAAALRREYNLRRQIRREIEAELRESGD